MLEIAVQSLQKKAKKNGTPLGDITDLMLPFPLKLLCFLYFVRCFLSVMDIGFSNTIDVKRKHHFCSWRWGASDLNLHCQEERGGGGSLKIAKTESAQMQNGAHKCYIYYTLVMFCNIMPAIGKG